MVMKTIMCSDLDSMSEGEVGVNEFGELPFGACEDPVRLVLREIK